MEDKIYLKEVEINLIKDFIEKAKHNKLIECIYIMPFNNQIHICSIINIAMKNSLLNYREELRKYKEEITALKVAIKEFRRNITNDAYDFEFELDYSENYNVDLENTLQILSARKLVSSYLVYDKYQYYDELIDILSTKVAPFDNIMKIENFFELNENYIKVK